MSDEIATTPTETPNASIETSYVLREHCHASTGLNDDYFVGIRAESSGLEVYFPYGYDIPSGPDALRFEIRNLLRVLERFSKRRTPLPAGLEADSGVNTDLPIGAYIRIVELYRNANSTYFSEKATRYKRGVRGKKNWKRTQRSVKPVFQNGNCVYLDFVVQEHFSDDTQFITLIHEYCVYHSFLRVGFLFPGAAPKKPRLQYLDKRAFLEEIYRKKREDFNDQHNILFDSMIAVVESLGEQRLGGFTFGTEHFEYVWENVIDHVFGVPNKNDFYPMTQWSLRDGQTIKNEDRNAPTFV